MLVGMSFIGIESKMNFQLLKMAPAGDEFSGIKNNASVGITVVSIIALQLGNII